jgi:hypothetical protein
MPWAEKGHPFGVKKGSPLPAREELPCRGNKGVTAT